MDSNRLNGWLTLGANIGVLIGIALLVYELRQNHEMVVAQTRHDISNEYTDFMLSTAENEDIADIVYRKLKEQEVTPQENMRYQFRLNAWFSIAANVHYQYRQGLYDQSEFEAIKQRWRGFANASPAIDDHWCQFRSQYTQVFRNEMNALFQNLNC